MTDVCHCGREPTEDQAVTIEGLDYCTQACADLDRIPF